MYKGIPVSLFNLVLSMSDALDLASPELQQHQIRTAYIALELARQSGMNKQDIENLVIASLIHDIGALTPEEKIDLHEADTVETEPHCALGEQLLKGLPVFLAASRIVRLHHHSWQDLMLSVQMPVTAQAQMLALADQVERMIDHSRYILHQRAEIMTRVEALADREIETDLVNNFKEIAQREDFWLTITSPRLYSLLLHDSPTSGTVLDMYDLRIVSEMFRNLIDFRSRFTSTHSAGVSTSAALIAKYFGLTMREIELCEIAGNLHDLGKLMVPNSILEKQDKLTVQEFEIMKQHSYFTYMILNSVKGLEEIAEWAAFHHEKLNGNGYPFHIKARKLNVISRILAVADIFTALAEDRPYRPGMDMAAAMAIIKKMGDDGMLDQKIISVLEGNLDDIVDETKRKQARTREYYEKVFEYKGKQ